VKLQTIKIKWGFLPITIMVCASFPLHAETKFGIGLALGSEKVVWEDELSSEKTTPAAKFTFYANGRKFYSLLDFQANKIGGGQQDSWQPYNSLTPTANSPAAFAKINVIAGYRVTQSFSWFTGLHLQVINDEFEDPLPGNTRGIEHSNFGAILGVTYNVPVNFARYNTALGFSFSHGPSMDGQFRSGGTTAATNAQYYGYGAKWIFPITNYFTVDVNYIYSKTVADFGTTNVDNLFTLKKMVVTTSMSTIQTTFVF